MKKPTLMHYHFPRASSTQVVFSLTEKDHSHCGRSSSGEIEPAISDDHLIVRLWLIKQSNLFLRVWLTRNFDRFRLIRLWSFSKRARRRVGEIRAIRWIFKERNQTQQVTDYAVRAQSKMFTQPMTFAIIRRVRVQINKVIGKCYDVRFIGNASDQPSGGLKIIRIGAEEDSTFNCWFPDKQTIGLIKFPYFSLFAPEKQFRLNCHVNMEQNVACKKMKYSKLAAQIQRPTNRESLCRPMIHHWPKKLDLSQLVLINHISDL